MMKTIRRCVKPAITLMLCAALLCALSCPAFADGEGEDSLIDPARLQSIADGLITQYGVNGDNFSIGYCYLATGDTWYYNEDGWFYAASVYKVPLMMLMAEKVSSGELTQDSVINGITLAEAESLILTYSNNDYARDLRFNYMGGDEMWVKEAQKFSDLAESDYDENYLPYRYYNARYIVDVLKTLYSEPERFPNVIDCLLLAEPGAYFRSTLEGRYDIAQKYGAYIENDGTNNNHAVGVIYTPNPIIVSVMTKNIGSYESLIGDAAKQLVDYTLELDSQLAAYERQQAEAAEAQRLAQEQAQREAEEQARREAEAEAQRLAQEQAALEQAARKEEIKKWLLIGGAVLVAAAVVVSFAISAKRGRKSRRKVAAGNNSDNYRPRH